MPNCRSEKRKKPASRSPTTCCAPKPRATPTTVAGATNVVSGMPSCLITRSAATIQVMVISDHSMTSATARERLVSSDATRPCSMLIAHLVVEVRAVPGADPLHEPDEQQRTQDEEQRGEQAVRQPVGEVGELQGPDPIQLPADCPDVVPGIRLAHLVHGMGRTTYTTRIIVVW